MEELKSINAIVVMEKYAALKSQFLSYNHKLWGKSLVEWVAASLGKIAYSTVEIESRSELLDAIISAADDDSKITVVLFSDTPLITSATILDAVSTLKSEQLPALKMTRGFVFKTEHLVNLNTLDNIPLRFFNEEDFITAAGYKQLSLISDILRNRILDYHMDNGVYIIDAGTTYIDSNAQIAGGVTIHPNNHIAGNCVLSSDVILKPNNMLKNAVIKSGATVWASTIEDSEIGSGTAVGPYAYIRNGAVIGENCRIGDYVEIKKSNIGNATKMAHLTYVGDAEIGEKCNFGCGVIFANYDGTNKSKTIVGNRVFVGSNCNLVAPVTINDGAFIAAGTTVTHDIPEGKFAIGRSRQELLDHEHNYHPK